MIVEQDIFTSPPSIQDVLGEMKVIGQRLDLIVPRLDQRDSIRMNKHLAGWATSS